MTAPRARRQPLLLMACTTDPEVLGAAKRLNSERAIVIYQNAGETGGKYDDAKFRDRLAHHIPEGQECYVALDFEGHWLAWQSAMPGSAAHLEGEARMLDLLRVAREVRPNARFAFYGVPNVRNFVGDGAGRTVRWDQGSPDSIAAAVERGRIARALISHLDWVAPTIYDLWETTDRYPHRAASQVARVNALVGLAVELAEGKPVFPFVWHRVRLSAGVDGLKLMANSQFLGGQLRPSLASGAAGVIWWGSDRHHIAEGIIGRSQPEEVAHLDITDPEAVAAYVRETHLDKLGAIAPLFPPNQIGDMMESRNAPAPPTTGPRAPATVVVSERMLKWFGYDHLPANLQQVSQPFWSLANEIDANIAPGPERTVALRKLLEAKDAAVRAALNPGG